MTAYDIEIDGRPLRLSNLQKVLYPASGFTKAHVIDYYRRIAPVLLPHLRDRPLTLKRYPEGVDHNYFYEKNCPSHRPAWLSTVPVWSERNDGVVNYCVVNDLASLVWAANLADIELHPSLSVRRDLTRPTALVFDLDPGEGVDVVACARVALLLRERLVSMPLQAYPKTSGGKGLQVYVPLNSETDYDASKTFARRLAQSLEKRFPNDIASRMQKTLRRGKVLIDWSQNDQHKTTVCVYSLRAQDPPTVSTPLHWHEVETLAVRGDRERVRFSPEAVLARVHEFGDLFAPVLDQVQPLPVNATGP